MKVNRAGWGQRAVVAGPPDHQASMQPGQLLDPAADLLNAQAQSQVRHHPRHLLIAQIQVLLDEIAVDEAGALKGAALGGEGAPLGVVKTAYTLDHLRGGWPREK